MKLLFLNLFILIYLISPTSVYSIEHTKPKNLVLHKEPIKLDNVKFRNDNNDILSLKDFNNKLVILNFWATWCAPCREEMPSLDKISNSKLFKNLKIIPINVGNEKMSKSKKFFSEINIKNLQIYYDNSLDLPKKLLLRGIPTTLIINKNGEEIGRVLGSINFTDKNFINWLKNYD